LINFFIIKKHPLVKETFMERRQIVAAIVKIANELDQMGMYSEANELTKIAQSAGSQFMQGLRDIGEGSMRGITGLGKDIAKGVGSGYDAARQGVSDAGELLGNMGSESGYSTGAGAREMFMGAANISNAQIDAQIESLRTFVSRNDTKAVDTLARTIDGDILRKIQVINNGPGAGTTTAKEEVAKLMRKQFEVRQLRKKVQPRSAVDLASRGEADQLQSNRTFLSEWVNNRKRRAGRPLTKGELYQMAINERDMNFANDIQGYLEDKGFMGRNDIVK
jgi:hypothetical protein